MVERVNFFYACKTGTIAKFQCFGADNLVLAYLCGQFTYIMLFFIDHSQNFQCHLRDRLYAFHGSLNFMGRGDITFCFIRYFVYAERLDAAVPVVHAQIQATGEEPAGLRFFDLDFFFI